MVDLSWEVSKPGGRRPLGGHRRESAVTTRCGKTRRAVPLCKPVAASWCKRRSVMQAPGDALSLQAPAQPVTNLA